MITSAPQRQDEHIKEGGRAALWSHIFGEQTGLMAVWSGRRVPDQKDLADPTTRYYEWPSQSPRASVQLDHESAGGREAYVCAHLLTKRRRIKENAAMMLAAYVDGDGAQPGPDLPPPTAVIESSPDRQQFYWRFTVAIDPKRAEQISKRLAYAMGADKSGWDLTQVLRAPGTRNWKYTPAPTVEIVSIEDQAYDPDELERILPEIPAETTVRAEVKLERSATATPIGDRDQRARERMHAARRGSEIQMLANGGSVKSKPEGGPDVSGDDLSYASALAFWFDKDPARMASEMGRSNRVRDKWNEVHSAKGETYLEMTIGKAISGCSQSFREMTGYDAGDEPPTINWFSKTPEQPTASDQAVSTGEPTTLEEALVEITRLRRRALDQDDRIEQLAGLEEDRQTIIRAQRTRLEVLEPYVAYIQDVVTRDENECPSDDKVVLIGFVPWLQTYRAKQLANGESTAFSLKYGAKVIGMHHKRLSNVLGRWSSPDPNDGAPWYKKVTRTRVTNDDGTEDWDSALEVTPWQETPREILRASLAYVPPVLPKKRGGSQEATAHRWSRCTKHPHGMVDLQGRCSVDGELLGAVRVTPEDFEALKSRFVLSETTLTPPVVVLNLSGDGNGISGPTHDDDSLKVQPVDSAEPVSLFDYAASRPHEQPGQEVTGPRCGYVKPNGRTCSSTMYRDQGGGRLRCLGCGLVGTEALSWAVSGGSE